MSIRDNANNPTVLLRRRRVVPALQKESPPIGGFGLLKLDLLAPSLALALRAIGCADVRSGILPAQSGLRRDDALAKACIACAG
jgi:hypothetical protein